MAIVSIKRYLNLGTVEEKPGSALALVLERLADCMIDWDPGEMENFREAMEAITGGLAPDLPQKEILTIAEEAMQAVENYNRRTCQMVEKQYRDFQTIIKMLQDSIVKIASENTESVQGLSKIDEVFERGAGFKDLQSLRIHLGVCLPNVRKEIEREKNAAKSLIERLQIELENTAKPGEKRGRRRVDLATGLPDQEACVAAIREVIQRGTRHYVAVMVVNRVEPIAARFGKEAADWMLARFRELVESQLEESDLLFRWGGPSIVAVLERPQSFDLVRSFFKRLFETPVNETIDVNGRSVFVPISAAWSVFMVSPVPEATERQIQKFIAAQGCRDFV